jgi:protein-disulfide isomerase
MIRRLSILRLRSFLLLSAAGALFMGAVSAQDSRLISAVGQKQMLAALGTASAGARKPDVTIVEYFDYNCPYCKKLVATFQTLLAQDSKVAIVYKDWPILGAVSVYAARSALAAQWQGKYLLAHDTLIRGPRLAKNEQVDALLQQAGVDMAALDKDRQRHATEISALLARSEEEAQALTLKGTPGVVVGRRLVDGNSELEDLQKLIAQSRHEK